jgi:hypothetical protein
MGVFNEATRRVDRNGNIKYYVCKEFLMNNEKSIVITAYGNNEKIDKIAVSLFDRSGAGYYDNDESNAKNYCAAINDLKLEGKSWVFAKIVSENIQYPLEAFLPLKFDILLTLDNLSIQRVLREVDSQEIAKALKGDNELIAERIFTNMSKRAAQMLKEDMEYMGPIRTRDINNAQEKIVDIICRLRQSGETVITYKGEITE